MKSPQRSHDAKSPTSEVKTPESKPTQELKQGPTKFTPCDSKLPEIKVTPETKPQDINEVPKAADANSPQDTKILPSPDTSKLTVDTKPSDVKLQEPLKSPLSDVLKSPHSDVLKSPHGDVLKSPHEVKEPRTPSPSASQIISSASTRKSRRLQVS